VNEFALEKCSCIGAHDYIIITPLCPSLDFKFMAPNLWS
jgi:hypothetical protein